MSKLQKILADIRNGDIKYTGDTRKSLDSVVAMGLARLDMLPFGDAIRFQVRLTLEGIRALVR
jgi:hypothetical protein